MSRILRSPTAALLVAGSALLATFTAGTGTAIGQEAELAAAESHLTAQGELRDATRAAELLRRAADNGSARAAFLLGHLLETGDGVGRDPAAAAGAFRRAAEAGHAAAQDRLGVLLTEGVGVRQDFRQAVAWFTRASDQGNVSALAHLAAMHYHGRGTPHDYGAAFALYHRAAVRGDTGAMLILGNMSLHGLGTRRSPVDAYRWYDLVLRAGSSNGRVTAFAERLLERLAPHLSSEEIGDAFASAEAWATAHPEALARATD